MSDRLKLLVVEDEKDLLELISEELVEEGFDVAQAENGNQAIEELRKNHYDIVLSDVRMPFCDGHKLLSHINSKKTKGKKPDVVIWTGYSDYKQDDFMSMGAKQVIYKPFEIDDILKLLKNYKLNR